MTETFRPIEANLGENCMFWRQLGARAVCCTYPRIQIEGRTSCEGMIDDVCLWMLRGREPVSLTHAQMVEIRTNPPNSAALPPGELL